MLQAIRAGAFSSAYDITLDGRLVTRWDRSMWRSRGSFTVQGQRYEVRANFWNTTFTMIDQAGRTVASTRPSRTANSAATRGRAAPYGRATRRRRS